MLSFSTGPADNPNGSSIQTMRLRDDPPPIIPATRTSRKRKSPPTNANNPSENQPIPQQQQQQQQQQPPPPPQPQQPQMPHGMPQMMVPMQGGVPMPPYHYDFTPGGMPPPPSNMQPPPDQGHSQSPPPNSSAGRALSSSKRAEQNRKAQRAFRERRDQLRINPVSEVLWEEKHLTFLRSRHVKALESRSQLLDAALASADEANRRWEECRALVDQLRVENAALRAALSQAQLLPPGAGGQLPQQLQQQQLQQNTGNSGLQQHNNGAHLEENPSKPEGVVSELKNDSAEVPQEQKPE